MNIKSNEIKLVNINDIQPNNKNRNHHSEEQIDRLVEIIKYQGFRSPLIISNRSGILVSGHGRLLAARKLGLAKLPVIYQDFDSEEQEYAAGISENSIASWAELDLAGINFDLQDLGPDFDLDLLGIKEFVLDKSEIALPDLPTGDKPHFEQITFTLHSSQAMEVRSAMEIAKNMGPFTDGLNENSNGNAITRVCEVFVAKQK